MRITHLQCLPMAWTVSLVRTLTRRDHRFVLISTCAFKFNARIHTCILAYITHTYIHTHWHREPRRAPGRHFSKVVHYPFTSKKFRMTFFIKVDSSAKFSGDLFQNRAPVPLTPSNRPCTVYMHTNIHVHTYIYTHIHTYTHT